MCVAAFTQPIQTCWKLQEKQGQRGFFSCGAKLLFWQLEAFRNHWKNLLVLSCCGKQGFGISWLHRAGRLPKMRRAPGASQPRTQVLIHVTPRGGVSQIATRAGGRRACSVNLGTGF